MRGSQQSPDTTNVQIKVKTNAPDYVDTLRLYGRARKMSHDAVVNRFAQQANFYCVKSEKQGGVKRAKLGKFPLNATADPQKGGKTYKQRFFYAERASHGVKKGSGGKIVMRPAAFKAYNKRRTAKGAMAAGFLQSARELGLKKRGPKDAQVKPGKSASRSKGHLAGVTAKAYSINAVEGSYEVGRITMDSAIAYVIKDSHNYAIGLLERDADKLKSRK